MLPAKSYIGLVDLVSDQCAWSVTSPTGLVARKVFREDCWRPNVVYWFHLVTGIGIGIEGLELELESLELELEL